VDHELLQSQIVQCSELDLGCWVKGRHQR
jgi:hypothetical protein